MKVWQVRQVERETLRRRQRIFQEFVSSWSEKLHNILSILFIVKSFSFSDSNEEAKWESKEDREAKESH